MRRGLDSSGGHTESEVQSPVRPWIIHLHGGAFVHFPHDRNKKMKRLGRWTVWNAPRECLRCKDSLRAMCSGQTFHVMFSAVEKVVGLAGRLVLTRLLCEGKRYLERMKMIGSHVMTFQVCCMCVCVCVCLVCECVCVSNVPPMSVCVKCKDVGMYPMLLDTVTFLTGSPLLKNVPVFRHDTKTSFKDTFNSTLCNVLYIEAV